MRSLATWEAILEAAAQLFQELGYSLTTTNKVAERAGVSIGSLYQYFPDKDALLQALAEKHLQQGAEILSAALIQLEHEQADFDATLSILIRTAVALHEQDPAMHRLLFDQTPRTPETVQYLRGFEEMLAEAVAQHLQRLGVGGADPRVRALLLVQGLEAQIHGAVLAPPRSVDREAVIVEIELLWRAALLA